VEVIERAFALSRRAHPNEWIGRLITEVREDAAGTYVVVLGIVPDSEASVTPAYAESSPMANSRVNELAERAFGRSAVGGPAHGHTGCGATYSVTDRANQRGWPDPWALGLVVDPWGKPDVGVYRGPDSERLVEVMRTARRRRTDSGVDIASATGPRGSSRATWIVAGMAAAILGAQAILTRSLATTVEALSTSTAPAPLVLVLPTDDATPTERSPSELACFPEDDPNGWER